MQDIIPHSLYKKIERMRHVVDQFILLDTNGESAVLSNKYRTEFVLENPVCRNILNVEIIWATTQKITKLTKGGVLGHYSQNS